MVSSQILKGCLDELREITRTEFCLQDTAGKIVVCTQFGQPQPETIVSAFVMRPSPLY